MALTAVVRGAAQTIRPEPGVCASVRGVQPDPKCGIKGGAIAADAATDLFIAIYGKVVAERAVRKGDCCKYDPPDPHKGPRRDTY